MAGMMGAMAGSGLSSGGRSLIRMVTTATLVGGAGLAGAGLYGQSLPPEAESAKAFLRDNATWLIAVGVAVIVLGAVLSFVARARMMKQMQSQMGGMMGGMGGMGMGGLGAMPGRGPMPDLAAMQAMMGQAAQPIVKVKCRACSTLQAEGAAFCSSCGKPM